MKTILIIDDEIDILELIHKMLENAGYNVETATDGREGITKTKEKAPDLIILDIMMSGMDGVEVAEELKSDSKTRDIPILALTVLTSNVDIKDIMASGVNEYMAKPFEKTKLLEKVREML